MSDYGGRLIRATEPTVSTTTASGIWTIEEALKYKQAGTWPVQQTADPNFNQTVLLLHGNGNQGANNLYNPGPPRYLAFTDNSDNNFPITVNGDAYGDNFSSFMVEEGQWSNYFDGTGDYLTAPQSTAFDLSGDFTVECWVNFNSVASTSFVGKWGGSGSYAWVLQYIVGTGLRFYTGVSGALGTSIAGAWTPVANTWYHIAATRSSNSVRLFVDGVQVGSTTTNSDNCTTTNQALNIGRNADTNIQLLTGYISNLRILKGTAQYTSNFTPPTTPLTAITNTSLLTCQSNRFVDNSTNAFAITRNGDVSVKPFNPFTTTYSSTNGSGYFDGSGDYLTLARNSAFFPVDNEDFTFEAWVYLTAAPGATGATIITAGEYGALSDFFFFIDSSRQLTFYFSTGALTCANTGTLVPINAWTHVAVSRSGTSSNNLKVFVNGVGQSFTTNNTTVGTGNYNLTIGADQNGDESNLTGYISNLRIVKGTAVYTSNFTPSTTPLTAITNTQLLTLQYQGSVRNVGFIDSSPYDHVITRNGNTTQGTFSPFSLAAGEWSNYFDGTGDYLTWPGTTLSGNFTVECWVYKTAVDVSGYTNVFYGSGNHQFAIDFGGVDGSIGLLLNGTTVISGSGTAITRNAWHHIAWVREGTTCRAYVNGVQQGTGTSSASFTLTEIGRYGLGGYEMNGYISNIRITNACLYPSGTTFTPSALPFTTTVSSGTVQLLTCQSNRFVDNSTNAFAITRNGDTRVTPFSPFAPTAAYSAGTNGGSGYFDGSNTRLNTPTSSQFNPAGDFTIGLWFYPNSALTINQNLIGNLTTNVSTDWLIQMVSGTLQFYTNGTTIRISSATAIRPFEWNYITMTRSSNVISAHVNGTLINTYSQSGAFGSATKTIEISNATSRVNGYLSGIILRDGTADTTVPTAPPTNVSGTSLLLNFTNAGIFDQTGKNVLETVGNAQIDTTTKKYGTGSLKFDGTGDYLIVPSSVDLGLGTGNFTIECWTYFNGVSTQQNFIDARTASVSTAPILYITATGVVNYSAGGAALITSSSNAVSATTWTHIALSRSGGSSRLFVNGVQVGSTATDTTNFGTTSFTLGAVYNGTNPMNGFIDDLRITKGVARYTANFTPPAAAFQDK